MKLLRQSSHILKSIYFEIQQGAQEQILNQTKASVWNCAIHKIEIPLDIQVNFKRTINETTQTR